MDRPRQKRIRLLESAYSTGGTAWLVSIATSNRQEAFSAPIFAGLVVSCFEIRAEEMDIELDLYCLMPDHMHLLVQIRETSLIEYVRDVKSRTTRDWWAEGGQGQLWQRSFHDRGLRTHADFDAATRYILNNPIEAGLVEAWQDYPLIGGALITDTTRS
jgi:putative transposase